MTIVGTAEVIVHASTHGFAKELEVGTKPAFAAVESEAEAAGIRSGEAMSAGVSSTSSKSTKAYSGLAAAGHKAFLGIGVAAVAALGESAHLAEGMQKVDATIAGATHTSTAAATKIGDAMLGTAGKSEFSGDAMAKAFAGAAGQLTAVNGKALNAGQALEVMNASGALATAKQIDLGDATKVVSSTLQAFGLGVEHAAHVSDVLFNASNATGTSVDALGAQLAKMHSKLGDSAGSLSQLSGLLVDMTQHGVTGRAALTGLSSGMTTIEKTAGGVVKSQQAQTQAFDAMSPSLQKLAWQYQQGKISSSEFGKATAGLPPAQATLVSSFNKSVTAVNAAQQKYKDLGVTVFDSKGKFVGMGSVIDQLAPKFSHMSDQQKLTTATQIFGASAAKQMIAVIDAGPAAYEKATQSVAKHGSAESAAEKQAKTLHGQEEILKNTIRDISTEIGEKLIPGLTKMATEFLHVTQYVMTHKSALIALAAVVTGVLGVAVTVFAVNKMVAFQQSFVRAAASMGIMGSKTAGTAAGIESVGVAAETTGVQAAAMGTEMEIGATAGSVAMEGMGEASAASAVVIDTAIGSTGIGLILIAVGVGATLLMTHWKQVMKALSDAAQTAVAFIKKHWGLITDILLAPIAPVLLAYKFFHGDMSGIFDSISNKIDSVWSGVKSTASSVVTSVSGFFSKLPGKIAAQVVGIPSDFVQLGKDILSGLIHGIESAPGAVSHALMGIAKGALGDVTHFLGISSPSKVMYEVGANTTKGFQLGVSETAKSSVNTPLGTVSYTTTSSPVANASSISNTAVAKQIMAFFTGRGLSTNAAAGIVGNLQQESGLNSSSPGGYIAQWGGSRLSGLQAFAAQQGTAVTNLNTQLMYIWKELNGLNGEGGALGPLKSAKTPTAAALAFMNLYERPKKGPTANVPNRTGSAEQAARLGGGAAPVSGTTKSGGSSKDRVKALNVEIAQERAALNKKIASEEAAVRNGTAAQKAAVAAEVVNQRAALAITIATQRAAAGAQTKQQAAELKKQTTDQKSGTSALNTLLKAIHTGSLASLNAAIEKVHLAGLGKIEKNLDADHSKALAALSDRLVAVHKQALAAQAAEQKKADDKAAADAAAAKDESDAGAIDASTKLASDISAAAAQAISDQTKVTLDKQNETGKTGKDLVAAQAQTALDQITQSSDISIAAAQQAVDNASSGTKTQQAQAAAALSAAQGKAAVDGAQAQANLDLANAAAQAADAAAQAASDAASATQAAAPDTSTPSSDSQSQQPIFHVTVYGSGVTAADIVTEVGWALRTGAIPLPAPAAG